ncbi:STM2901 family protein [Burkholderia ambifaria]|uniref:STM2901 family protein n=1 Tax=Burkholderia ambifaria TaxID=152480 RepID=UPI003C7CD430
MNNTYDFGTHRDLTPMELFFLVFIDETCRELGVDDVAAVVAIVTGQNWMPTRAKPFGTTPGTSVASILSRKYLDYDLKKKILPTLTNASVKRLKFILVRNIGVFVGRAVPVVGWVIAANNATTISIRSVSRYNALVKPEDKGF